MADSKKAEKLAAARKLLKQFQENKDVGQVSQINKSPEPYIQHTYNGNSVHQNKEINEVTNGSNKNTLGLDSNQIMSDVNSFPQNSASYFFASKNSSALSNNFFDTLTGNDKSTVDKSSEFLEPAEKVSVVTTSVSTPVINEVVQPDESIDSSLGDKPNNLSNPHALPTDILELQHKYESSTSELAQEKQKYVELKKQLNLATDRIASLENEIKGVQQECSNRLSKEVEHFEDQMKNQLRTIEILVSEKSELLCQVESLQDNLSTKSGQCDDLSGRLKASRSNVARLEKEVAELQEARNQHNNILKKLEQNVQENSTQSEQYRQQLEESENEVKELKRRFDASFNECSSMRRELEEKESQLSIAQIRIQQLGSVEGLDVANSDKIKQLNEEIQNLNKNILDLTNERDQSAHQYQQYINTLNSQLQDIASKYESLNVEKDDLKAREQGLVSHIGDMEKQMQKQMVGVMNTTDYNEQIAGILDELEKSKKIIENFTSDAEEKSVELKQLRTELETKCGRINELESNLEQLASNVPDAKLLQAAMESDKVAATRAIAQNIELKQKLSDMHEAFIRLSNNKLELMEQLEREQQCTAEMREELNQHKQRLVLKIDHSTQVGNGEIVDGCSQTTYHDLEESTPPNEAVSPEAVAMLKEKFRQTMNSLAELSEEKQRLEHLVLQLQGETETIGEYIALYQAQRSLLHQRACEKDQQVHAIAREKEDLRKKLAEITKLVPQLVQNTDVPLGLESADTGSDNSPPVETSNTASKILSLVSEIGTSSLVQDKASPESLNFHPCPLCSGRLITV